MIKQTLYWAKSVYIGAIIQIIAAGIPALLTVRLINIKSHNSVSDVYSIMLGSVFILISSYKLIHKLIFPEMVYEAGVIRFLGQKDGASGRQEVFTYNIASIVETKRKPEGFKKSEERPAYLIKTKKGEEYEFLPEMRKRNEKRIEKIRKYFRSCPGMSRIVIDDQDIRRPDLKSI